MSSRLTDAEKKYVSQVLMTACRNTPLEPQTTLVGVYLKEPVTQLLENWDEIRKNIHPEGTKTTVVHSDVKRRIIKP